MARDADDAPHYFRHSVVRRHDSRHQPHPDEDFLSAAVKTEIFNERNLGGIGVELACALAEKTGMKTCVTV